MRLLLKLASILVVGTLVIVGLSGIGLGKQLMDMLPFQTQTIDRSQPALLLSVQELGQYHAAVGNFQLLVDDEQDERWVPAFIAGERSLFVAAGTVNSYVDLTGLAEGDLRLSEDGKSVTLRLPEAELDKPNLDQENSYLADQDRGVLNRVEDAISTQDQSHLYQLAEEKLASAAEESDLEQQAEENTKAMLTGMFNSLDLKVTFTDDASEE
jgi:hypothetical protein